MGQLAHQEMQLYVPCILHLPSTVTMPPGTRLGPATLGAPARLAHFLGSTTCRQKKGRLADALEQRLAEEDLLDMEVLLRYRGIRTLRAVESLETTERAVLLCKARELYELL